MKKIHKEKCPICGKKFDPSIFTELIKHMHDPDLKIDPKTAKKIRARRVGDPVEWRGGRPTHLN